MNCSKDLKSLIKIFDFIRSCLLPTTTAILFLSCLLLAYHLILSCLLLKNILTELQALFCELPVYIQDICRHFLRQRKHLLFLTAPRKKNPKPDDMIRLIQNKYFTNCKTFFIITGSLYP